MLSPISEIIFKEFANNDLMKLNVRVGIFIGAVVALAAAAYLLDLRSALIGTLEWIGSLGYAGYLAFIAIYILATILFLPGSILTLGAGLLYGVLIGTILVSLGSILGATASFLIGRYLARDWVRKKLHGNERFKALDEAVGREGWKIVILTRLSPIFPFNLLNYAYSLTAIPLRHYFLASWVGMLPWTVVYVYIGSLAGDLFAIGTTGRSPLEWTVLIVGLVVTAILVWYVARIARKALSKKIDVD